MAQHFLLSTAARSLSLAKVARMSDDEARDAFRLIRWASTNGEAGLPVLRLLGDLHLPFASNLQMPGLRASIQRHLGDDLR